MWTEGVDLSHYNGGWDASKSKDQGVEFLIQKSYDVWMSPNPDETMYRNIESALNNDIKVVLLYGFFWPNYNALAQADGFYNVIDTVANEFDIIKLPVVDLERTGGKTDETITFRLRTYLNRLDVLIGRKAMIYTRGSWWNDHVLDKLELSNGRKLFIARYHSGLDHPWGDARYKPIGFDNYTFWQWLADGNNMGSLYGVDSDDIDLDRYNGTVDDLYKEFNIVDNEPDPLPDDIEERVSDLENRADAIEDDMFELEEWGRNINYRG